MSDAPVSPREASSRDSADLWRWVKDMTAWARNMRAWHQGQVIEGDGAPSAAARNGTLYLRRDGGAGSTLYVREGGSWVAK